jgi:hypothetical protein
MFTEEFSFRKKTLSEALERGGRSSPLPINMGYLPCVHKPAGRNGRAK